MTSVSLTPHPFTGAATGAVAAAGALPLVMAIAMAVMLTRETSDLNTDYSPDPGRLDPARLGIEPASATRRFDKQLILLGKLPHLLIAW